MRNFINKYSRISLAIVLAFLTSQLLVQEVFLGYTPRIRPDLKDRVIETSLALTRADTYIAFFTGTRGQDDTIAENLQDAQEKLDRKNYSPTVIRGVYAREIDNATQTQINLNEIEWIEIQYQKQDGSIIPLNIPRGTEPPPPGLF